ncbi:MAG: hypothetical protein F6K36_07080 [Symploca sp. SIO3C6]|nr:hypothetical protein [Symploca sp. SIO3C6]
MRRFFRTDSLFAISVVTFASIYWTITGFSVSASPDLEESLGSDLNKSGEATISKNNGEKDKKKRKSILERLSDFIHGKRRRIDNQGGRKFCLITPNKDSIITWSNTPVFAWQGTAANIRVWTYDKESDEEITMWSYELTLDDNKKQSVPYNYNHDPKAKMLEQGKEYDYSITPGEVRDQRIEVSKEQEPFESIFKLMELHDYEKIEEELKVIETNGFNELDNQELKGMTEKEKIAIKRALFFKDKKIEEENLFLDFAGELFSAEVESELFTSYLQQLRAIFCEKNKPEETNSQN